MMPSPSSGTPEMHVVVVDRVEKLAACFVYIKTERYEAVFLHCNLIPIVGLYNFTYIDRVGASFRAHKTTRDRAQIG